MLIYHQPVKNKNNNKKQKIIVLFENLKKKIISSLPELPDHPELGQPLLQPALLQPALGLDQPLLGHAFQPPLNSMEINVLISNLHLTANEIMLTR